MNEVENKAKSSWKAKFNVEKEKKELTARKKNKKLEPGKRE